MIFKEIQGFLNLLIVGVQLYLEVMLEQK